MDKSSKQRMKEQKRRKEGLEQRMKEPKRRKEGPERRKVNETADKRGEVTERGVETTDRERTAHRMPPRKAPSLKRDQPYVMVIIHNFFNVILKKV